MNRHGRLGAVARFLALAACCATSVGAVGAAGTVGNGPPTPPPAPRAVITGTDPAICDPNGDKREVIVLKGQFPSLDAHGAALIVSETGHPQIAVPYDASRMQVPSFSFAADAHHMINIVYDGTQWCDDDGQISFQLVMGGQISNQYSMRISTD